MIADQNHYAADATKTTNANPSPRSLPSNETPESRQLTKLKRIPNPHVLVSIATDIACHSPRVFPLCSAIISKLLSALKSKAKKVDTIQKIYAKLSQLPNTGQMEVWLQRISHLFVPRLDYKELLCKLAKGEPVTIWNNDWITSVKLMAALDSTKVVNKGKPRSLKPVVQPKEIAVFKFGAYHLEV